MFVGLWNLILTCSNNIYSYRKGFPKMGLKIPNIPMDICHIFKRTMIDHSPEAYVVKFVGLTTGMAGATAPSMDEARGHSSLEQCFKRWGHKARRLTWYGARCKPYETLIFNIGLREREILHKIKFKKRQKIMRSGPENKK